MHLTAPPASATSRTEHHRQPAMPQHRAAYLGLDISTTKTGVAVRARDGAEAYAGVDNTNDVLWKKQPAFDLAKQAALISKALEQLADRGWSFDAPGALSLSVRQHDMALVGRNDELLVPALSWQCNAAKAEVKKLRQQKAEDVVGRIEERFIVAKLGWALAQEKSLRKKLARVMTTGDWIAWQLTGECRLATSDALSNGLLAQKDKRLAAGVLEKAGQDSQWFPPTIQSGEVVGTVRRSAPGPWNRLVRMLAGWRVVAGLGDNHATGAGTGGLVDQETIVVSAGTSGTINRRIDARVPSPPHIARFEFYDDRLLLLMLGDCGQWYHRFKAQYPAEITDREFSLLAAAADPQSFLRVTTAGGEETYPDGWEELSLGEKTASTQFSIVLELLLLARSMDRDVRGAPPIRRFLLTGGLSQAPLVQHVFEAGIRLITAGREVDVQVSDRTGELAFQTAAYGALVNAMLPDRGGKLAAVAGELCKFRPCPTAGPATHGRLSELLRKNL
jgi:sugar (pentulose or hexulose) kinase